jgi:hypothetical protein
MSTYNRRFAAIARRRRSIGALGKTNRLNRRLIPGFLLKRSDVLNIIPLLCEWAWLELSEGWHTWRESSPDSVPAPLASETA